MLKEFLWLNHIVPLFRENLKLVKGMRERVAQGRACGNLGNIHYLLGNFEVAVKYHKEVRMLKAIIIVQKLKKWH